MLIIFSHKEDKGCLEQRGIAELVKWLPSSIIKLGVSLWEREWIQSTVLSCCPWANSHTPSGHDFIFSLLFLQNQSRWKAMSEEALKSVCAPGATTSLPPLPPLCAPSLDPTAASNQLELEMRYLVYEHRKVKCSTLVGLDAWLGVST